MTRIGIAQTDITPKKSVWLTGYGNRDHKSTGVYQALIAGAISIQGDTDETLIITADLIGYSLAYSAAAKMNIAQATADIGVIRPSVQQGQIFNLDTADRDAFT